ncbi:MAG: ATP-binding protein [Pseudomonadota bacterium]
MRLKIIHELFLLLGLAVLLSVTLAGGGVIWNLRGGFSDYIQALETQRLERFASYLAERAEPYGSLAPLFADGAPNMRRMMDGFQHREGRIAGEAPPAHSGGRERHPPHDDPPFRVQVFDRGGELLLGRPLPDTARVVTRPVLLHGESIGTLKLPVPSALHGVDARFIERQYQGVLLATLLSLGLTLLLAAWLAQRWVKPLRAVQRASRELAQGRFDSPLLSALPRNGSQELMQLCSDMRALGEDLRALEAARRRWIAQTSHELRTPLAVLRGEVESVEDGARQPSRELVLSLGEEVRQLSRLVDDLHILALADLGDAPCRMQSVEVVPTLSGIMQRLLARPWFEGLHVEVDLAPMPGVRADWDIGRIEQVLSNILLNSSRYTQRPGRLRVLGRMDRPASRLIVRIEDSAPGVSPGELDRLFDPLYRADPARRRDAGSGSGLGLSIVRAFVQAHGGHVHAESSALDGVAVVLVLPVHLPGDDKPAAEAPA